eukprot:3756366-Alexandrium_andersonii.AAC.1
MAGLQEKYGHSSELTADDLQLALNDPDSLVAVVVALRCGSLGVVAVACLLESARNLQVARGFQQASTCNHPEGATTKGYSTTARTSGS